MQGFTLNLAKISKNKNTATFLVAHQNSLSTISRCAHGVGTPSYIFPQFNSIVSISLLLFTQQHHGEAYYPSPGPTEAQ